MLSEWERTRERGDRKDRWRVLRGVIEEGLCGCGSVHIHTGLINAIA